jgi:hypothetical protein
MTESPEKAAVTRTQQKKISSHFVTCAMTANRGPLRRKLGASLTPGHCVGVSNESEEFARGAARLAQEAAAGRLTRLQCEIK